MLVHQIYDFEFFLIKKGVCLCAASFILILKSHKKRKKNMMSKLTFKFP